MRWGFIGASRVAAAHMTGAVRAQEGGEVVCVLSSDADRGRAYAEANDIARSHTDLEALLVDDIEAVYISTTNEKHHPQAMAAIAAGKHVLCEKPLAMNVGDAREMVDAAAARGLVFATNHHLRSAGSHIAIRDLIRSGHVGRVLSVRVFHAVSLPEQLRGWRINDAAAGGGVIGDIVVHDADTVRFHLGEDPQKVVAMAAISGLGHGVEDSVMSIWTMPSGVMVQTHESFTHAHAGTGIEVHGTEGTIRATGVMTQRPTGEIVLVNASGSHAVTFDNHNLYHRNVAAFVAAVRGEGRPVADGIDGIKSLAVAMAVGRSARDGQAVTVDYGGL